MEDFPVDDNFVFEFPIWTVLDKKLLDGKDHPFESLFVIRLNKQDPTFTLFTDKDLAETFIEPMKKNAAPLVFPIEDAKIMRAFIVGADSLGATHVTIDLSLGGNKRSIVYGLEEFAKVFGISKG